MKYFIIILVLLFGGLAFKLLFFPVNTANKLVDTAYQAQERTLNADNAIYNYEWFKQQKEDIDALGQKVGSAQLQADLFRASSGDRKDWTFEDKGEDARLQSIVTGLNNQYIQAVANYNARSKMANRAMFQDGILPSYIEALTFIKK